MGRSLLYCVTLCALLMGCSWGQPEPVVVDRPVEVSVHVPTYLRSCPEIPKANVDAMMDQADAADYTTRLHAVASTCKKKLDTVDDILSQHEANR